MDKQPEVANVVAGSGSHAVPITIDGHCTKHTMAALEEGNAGARPMPRQAIEKTHAQAVELLQQVVSSYAADVAGGEVGAAGTARAGNSAAVAGQCPTGLLYGRIQSGKTVAMITFAALAIDNGFRVVVVLTSDNVKLVDQTATRFRALEGIVMSSTQVTTWPAEVNHVRKQLPHVGLVLICAKNQSHLGSLIDFLKAIGAADYPALVMDDEADQATLDTTTNARAAGKPTAPKHGSTINRRTVMNDRADEAGWSVREVLRHHVLVQVTATPYALLLQNTGTPLRPKFTNLLAPGEGYTGGEHFFSSEQLEHERPPLVFVREEESDELERGDEEAPPGLVAALSTFLVAAGAQSVVQSLGRSRAQNFLCHTSQKRIEHGKLAELIRGYLDAVGDELRKPSVGGAVRVHLDRAYDELKRTLPTPPPIEAIFDDLRRRLPLRQVIVVNSDGGNAEFTHGINFIVGGNILGRGLTIDNLLVTYYLRHAKVSQMDTMLQHARMFGYRGALMPYTRVFLPESLALRFHRIHMAERHLRALLEDPTRRERIPVELAEGLKVTRNGVLDTRSILAYTPGQHLYPAAPLVTKEAHELHRRAREEAVKLGAKFKEQGELHERVEVSLEDIARLIAILPYEKSGEDTWDPRALQGLLRSSAGRFEGKGWLYSRKMARTRFTQGALGDKEYQQLKLLTRPTLCVFLDVGKKYGPPGREPFQGDFTYPTLLLPEVDGMPAHVFNVSE